MGATDKFVHSYGNTGILGMEKTPSNKHVPSFLLPLHPDSNARRSSLMGPPSPSLSPLQKRASFSGISGAPLPLTPLNLTPGARELRLKEILKFRENQNQVRGRQNSDITTTGTSGTSGDISPGTSAHLGVFERRPSNTSVNEN